MAAIPQLERKVGRQTVKIEFLKGCLQPIEEQRRLQALTGKQRRASLAPLAPDGAARELEEFWNELESILECTRNFNTLYPKLVNSASAA
jgi:hypothetical protein